MALQEVLRVEHQLRMLGDRRRVELGVVDEHDHHVGLAELLRRERHQRIAQQLCVHVGNVRIAEPHLGTARPQSGGHVDRRALAPVARRLLVRQAEQQHPAPVDRLALTVQHRRHPVVHVVGHVLVDVVGQLDEPERVPQVLLDPPRQVARVDRQTVPAHTRARRELHEPERLGRGGVDRSPDVDVEIAGEHRQLVDERDVDVPERVLEQFHHLGLGTRPDRHRAVDERREERVDHRQPLGRRPADHLGGVDQPVRGVARVDPLGRVPEEELVGGQPGTLREDRGEQLGGRSRIGRALEDHAATRTQMLCQVGAGHLDVRQVGQPVAQWRRHADDRDVEPCDVGRVRSRPVAGRKRPRQFVVGDVAHVRLTCLERLHAFDRRVEADDGEPDLDGTHRDRQADVPLPDHDDLRRPILDPSDRFLMLHAAPVHLAPVHRVPFHLVRVHASTCCSDVMLRFTV